MSSELLRKAAGRVREDEDLADLDAILPGLCPALAGWLEQEADDAAEREADGHTLGPRWPGLILARLIVGEG